MPQQNFCASTPGRRGIGYARTMSTPFRDTNQASELKCPRCKKQTLPALDVAPCPAQCGTLVSAFAATEIFSVKELRIDAVTRWWRRREPCPLCKEAMTLRGVNPGYFQGCEGHVFWVDADTIAQTGLANGFDAAKLQAKYESSAAIEQAQQLRVTAETDRANSKREKDEQEARLRQITPTTSTPVEAAAFSTLELIAVSGAIGPIATAILRNKFLDLTTRRHELENRVGTLEVEMSEIRTFLAMQSKR